MVGALLKCFAPLSVDCVLAHFCRLYEMFYRIRYGNAFLYSSLVVLFDCACDTDHESAIK